LHVLNTVGESIQAEAQEQIKKEKQKTGVQIILPLSLGLILLALALVMVYLRYRQARHLAGLGIWFDLVFYRKLNRKWNTKTRTVQRSVTIQTIAKRGYGLFGQWNVYVNLLHIRNVSLRNCHICYVTF